MKPQLNAVYSIIDFQGKTTNLKVKRLTDRTVIYCRVVNGKELTELREPIRMFEKKLIPKEGGSVTISKQRNI